MAQIIPTSVTIATGDPIEAEPLQAVINKLNEAISLLNSHDTAIVGKASTAALATLSSNVANLTSLISLEESSRQSADEALASNSVANIIDSQNLDNGILSHEILASNSSGASLASVPLGGITRIVPISGKLSPHATVQQMSQQAIDGLYWDDTNLCLVGHVSSLGPNGYCNNWGGEGTIPAAEELAATSTSGGWMEPFRNILFTDGTGLIMSLDGVTLSKFTPDAY